METGPSLLLTLVVFWLYLQRVSLGREIKEEDGCPIYLSSGGLIGMDFFIESVG